MKRNIRTDTADNSEPPKSLLKADRPNGRLIHQALCHEMLLRDIFWQPVQLSLAEMFAVLRDRQTIATIAAVSVAMMLADPVGLRGVNPVWVIVVLWAFGASLVILLKHVFSFLATLVQMRMSSVPIYMPLLSGFEYGIAIWLSEHLASALSGVSYQGALMSRFPQYLGMFLIVEYFVVRYIVPPVRLRLHGPVVLVPVPSDDTAAPHRVEIGGRALRLNRIRHISSQEHYLKVTLPDETLLVRGKLGEVLQSVPPAAGVQPHRSWWVAKGMRPRLRRSAAGKPEIELADGTRVPVARARIKDVQDWIDSHADW